MSDIQQQNSQIVYDAEKAKEEIDVKAAEQRQILADLEIQRVRYEAEKEVAQIQSDAQE